jgi:hypothetical protein
VGLDRLGKARRLELLDQADRLGRRVLALAVDLGQEVVGALAVLRYG